MSPVGTDYTDQWLLGVVLWSDATEGTEVDPEPLSRSFDAHEECMTGPELRAVAARVLRERSEA